MWCFTITTLTFLLISINPSLSNLKKSELQDAIDAFDSFDTIPDRSKSPRHKVIVKVKESPTEGAAPTIIEAPVVKEEAHCFTCPVKLNISNIDLIKLANNSLLTAENGSNLEFIRLIQAVREIGIGVVYDLKVEAVEKCDKDGDKICKNMICVLQLVHKPWKYLEPHLTYCNCTPSENKAQENLNYGIENGETDSKHSKLEESVYSEDKFQPEINKEVFDSPSSPSEEDIIDVTSPSSPSEDIIDTSPSSSSEEEIIDTTVSNEYIPETTTINDESALLDTSFPNKESLNVWGLVSYSVEETTEGTKLVLPQLVEETSILNENYSPNPSEESN